MFKQTMVRTSLIKGTVLKVLLIGLIGLSFYSYAATADAAILTVDVACEDLLPEGPNEICDVADTYKTIEDALAMSVDGDTISLASSITTSAQVNLKEGMTLEGNGNTLTAAFEKTNNSNNSAIGIQNSGVTVQNITVDGTGGINLHGINVYLSTGIVLNSVTVSNFRSGVVVNGSTVAATNLNTNGNAWNSINVDPGTGVNADSIFTLNSGNLSDSTQIWSDGSKVNAGVPLVIVNAEGYTQYKKAGTEDSYLWSDSTPAGALIGTTIYETLQDAIAGASEGDTINLGSGDYTTNGQVVIDKSLSVIGADKNSVIIKPTTDTTGNNVDSAAWFLVNDGMTFNLSNVTLDANSPTRSINWAIATYGNGTIDNNIIKNVRAGNYLGRGIVIFGDDVTVSNNTFINIERIGVHVRGAYTGPAVGNATVSGNTYNCKGDGDFLDYGVEVGAGASAMILNNTISECRGVASTDGSTSAAILVTDYYGVGTTATVNGNTITNSTNGLAVGYDETDISSVSAHNNSFNGNLYAIESTNPNVDASNNWWGNTNGPSHSSNPTGTGDAVSDNVTFTPWYLSVDMTVTSDAISGDTLTSPTEDIALGASGEANLPVGVTDIVLSNGSSLDLSSGLDTDEVVILNSGTPGEPTILSNSDMPGFTISFPDETAIDGPNDWDGIILPPVVGTAGGSAPSGFAVGGTVITVGSNDVVLTFDKPVTILLPGVTGAVGYRSTGLNTWVQIEDTCTNYDNPTGAPIGGECYVTNGIDTKISTYHFTSFGNLVATKKTGSSNSKAKKATPAVPAVPGVRPATPATPAVPAVAGASTYKFTQEFGFGAEGSQVSELQKKLSLVGLFTGPVTGYFGPLTQAALRNFQNAHGITATGYVGPLTMAQLNMETPTAVSESATVQLAAKQTELISLLKQMIAQLMAAR